MITHINEQEIYEKWAPLLEEQSGIKDTYKLAWLSKLCHTYAMNESWNLNESFAYGSYQGLGSVPGQGAVRPAGAPGGPLQFYTATTGSGDKFPSLLPLAIQVAARTVGFDIVSVIPMPGPTGVLTYLDYYYAGGKTGTEFKPLVIKINASDINATAYTEGAKYWGLSAASDTTNFASTVVAVELIFVGYSRVDGYPIFRVGSTYDMTGAGAAKTADTTVTLSQVFSGSAVITSDNSNAPQTSDAVGNTISVTAKPALVRALEDHIQGFAGAGTYDQDTWTGPYTSATQPNDPMGRGTGENTYYRQMGIQLFTKIVEAQTFQAAAGVTTEQIQDLNKQFGIDVINMIENALINDISQSINKNILSRAFALGWTNNAEMLKTEGVTLNFSLDRTVLADGNSPYYLNKIGFTERIAYKKFQDYGDFENLSTMQRRIKSKVLAAGNVVAQRGRRGPANFVVTNLQLATALQDNAQYTMSPMNNTLTQQVGSLYPVGQVAGMTVYVDPNMRFDDTRILVGRKGADEEPGIKFCPYLMAESIQTIAEGTMSPKIAVKSRYALVESGHWPELSYYTLFVYLGSNIII
jgi:hypothetical protein